MGDQVLVLLGTLSGALLAHLFQTLTAARQRRQNVADRARVERLEAAAALPGALVDYRRSQIARRLNKLSGGAGNENLDRELRGARAQAWTAVYRFELLVADQQLRGELRQLMAQIKGLKGYEDEAALNAAGTAVHHGVQQFIELVRIRLALG